MRSIFNRTALLAAALSLAIAGAGCGDDESEENGASASGSEANASGSSFPDGSEPVELDPADFTTEIDNPYWPMSVGSRWVYSETDLEGTNQKVVVTVTDKTVKIANGVEARVVRDVVSEDGEPVEITDDWYAQDSDGNIWYMGEETAEYENGKIVTRAGSFEASADGADAGIIMPADPQVGQTYRQEYYEGEAEDEGKVLSLDEQVEVPFGHFPAGEVLMTRDTNPLEPKVNEHKFYARDVGPVLTVDISDGNGREDLLSYKPG